MQIPVKQLVFAMLSNGRFFPYLLMMFLMTGRFLVEITHSDVEVHENKISYSPLLKKPVLLLFVGSF